MLGILLKLCTHDQDLRICIYANFAYVCKSFFLLCVHMAFKDQQNLSKVEILFYKSNSYFLELMLKYFNLDPASE